MKYAPQSFAVVAALLAVAADVHGQSRRDPRVGLALSGGLATIPDAVGAQCGRNGDGDNGGGPEASATVLVRPWRWALIQSDVRSAHLWLPNGCNLVGYPIDTSYFDRTRRRPFSTSTVRAGLETPAGMPLVRATAGIGWIWGTPTLPVTMFGIAVGTRGRRVRLLVEAERLRTRVDAEEVRRGDGGLGLPQVRPIVVHPVWHSVRAGVEIPLVR